MIYDSPAQADTALIIDLSNLAYRAYYGNSELKTKDGRPSGHIYGSINMLLTIFRDLGESLAPVFCFDGVGARAERQKVLPEYKGNRKQRDFDPIHEVKDICSFLPGVHIEQEGREGDDAIAYACKLCASKNVIIYSGDKDIQALINDKIKVYSPNKGRFIESADIYDAYHVLDPAKIYVMKALTGDPSDNIKGIPRIPKKQLESILDNPNCVDVESFYKIIDQRPPSMTETMWKRAVDLKDQIKRNYSVIIPNVTGFDKRSVKRVLKSSSNKENLLSLLRRYGCYSILDKINGIFEPVG